MTLVSWVIAVYCPPLATRLIILPLSLIPVAVWTCVYSITIGLSMQKIALIQGTIFFYVLSFSLANVVQKVSEKHVTVMVSNLSISLRNIFLGRSDIIGIQIIYQFIAFLIRICVIFVRLRMLVTFKKFVAIDAWKKVLPTLWDWSFYINAVLSQTKKIRIDRSASIFGSNRTLLNNLVLYDVWVSLLE